MEEGVPYEPTFVPTDRGKVARTLFLTKQDGQESRTVSRESSASASVARKSTTAEVMTLLTTMNETILKLVSKTEDQHRTIQAQNATIESLSHTVKELHQKQEATNTAMRLWRDETRALFKDMAGTIAEIHTVQSRSISSTSLPSRDWPSLPSGTTFPSQPSDGSHANPRDEAKILTVNLERVQERSGIKGAPLATVRDKFNKALAAGENTKDIAVQHIKSRAGNKVELIMTSEEQCKKARVNPRWLEVSAPGARVIGETWFPVKCDNVFKADVVKENGDGWTFRDDVLEKFNEENSREGSRATAKKIHWLSKPSERATGSLVVYLSSREAAQRLLRENVAIFGGCGAFVQEFVRQARPERCFKCNQYGHRQSRCMNQEACGICARPHQTRECDNLDNPKCAACQGPHRVTDEGCRLYRAERAKLREGANNQEGRRQRSTPCL